jgi:hypothetical protein|tara:strand:+ start:298 stop:522 length:225 start_codon:yes stop_codon:yes gene_type:complete
MRSMVTKGGILTWINVVESEFIESHFSGDVLLEQTNLNEREKYIAQTLVGRGVLDKVVSGKQVNYKLNINKFGQ